MAVVLFPYHLDEHLPDLAAELPPGLAYSCPEQAGTGSEHEHAPPREDIWHRLSALYEALADAVASAGDRPTVVSGDCTSVLGTMAGLQRAGVDPAVVWFDAHGDVQTLETTTSGYIGGYSLRMLVGYRPELIAEGLGLRPLDERRALLVDARDLDPPEVTYLATAGIRRCAVDGVDADVLPA